MQSHAAGADQAGGLELSITTRPNAVARRRVQPGWRVRAQYYNQAKYSCMPHGAIQAGGLELSITTRPNAVARHSGLTRLEG